MKVCKINSDPACQLHHLDVNIINTTLRPRLYEENLSQVERYPGRATQPGHQPS